MHSPHSSERQKDRQRGLLKQTFELDEADVAERQDDQVDATDVRALKHTMDWKFKSTQKHFDCFLSGLREGWSWWPAIMVGRAKWVVF